MGLLSYDEEQMPAEFSTRGVAENISECLHQLIGRKLPVIPYEEPVFLPDATPIRVVTNETAHKRSDCPCHFFCLQHAAKEDWEGMTCLYCPNYLKGQKH